MKPGQNKDYRLKLVESKISEDTDIWLKTPQPIGRQVGIQLHEMLATLLINSRRAPFDLRKLVGAQYSTSNSDLKNGKEWAEVIRTFVENSIILLFHLRKCGL